MNLIETLCRYVNAGFDRTRYVQCKQNFVVRCSHCHPIEMNGTFDHASGCPNDPANRGRGFDRLANDSDVTPSN